MPRHTWRRTEKDCWKEQKTKRKTHVRVVMILLGSVVIAVKHHFHSINFMQIFSLVNKISYLTYSNESEICFVFATVSHLSESPTSESNFVEMFK